MHIHASTSAVEVLAPAKLNLFLEVVARRPDGYHELESLMVPIGLYDSLRLEPAPASEFSLTCRQDCRASEPLAQGGDNLVMRAVRLLAECAGINRGARLHLTKRIPWAAGLGGGSSDAAAALVAANRAWQLDWPTERLSAIAAELGSDIPFFLVGGPALARGRGELLEPIAGLAPLATVVVRPPEGLSTPAVFRGCQPGRSSNGSSALVAALRSGDLGRIGNLLHNGLEAAARRLSPWIARLAEEFGRLGCRAHAMSGSGSAYFGIFDHPRHARRIAATLGCRGLGQAYAVGTCH